MDLSTVPEWAQWAFTDEQLSVNNLLYGGFSVDDTYQYKDALIPSEKSIIDKYYKLSIKPVIKTVNLNADQDGPVKTGYIAGMEITF